MRLNKTEREALRKRVKILIPQMEKSDRSPNFLDIYQKDLAEKIDQ